MATLRGVRVLRIGDAVGAAYCGKLLHGFGAHTRSITSPDGTRLSATPAEAAWFGFERDRIAFDWSDAEAAEKLATLLKDCDVLIDASRPGSGDRYGLTADALRQRHPQLIVCRVTPFGNTGPYRDFVAEDITLYAMSGLMQSTGNPTREPLNSQPKLAQLSAGLHAYAACLLALLRRGRDGGGDFIDLSVHETSMENIEIAITEHLHAGNVARRNGDEHNMVPWRDYSCADGEAVITAGPLRNWPKAAELFGIEEIKERYMRADLRMKDRKGFEALLKPWLMTHERRELFHAGQKRGLAWAYLGNISETLADPQHAARGFFEDQTLADGTRCRMPGAPFQGSVSRWGGETGAADAPAAKPAPAGGTAQPALQGLRVLDFTHDWAGPHAARMLADYGAEVIKVEYPKLLDAMRGGYPAKVNDFARVWQLHRGKRSVTLDLKRADHLEFCKKLVADCDVVIENSRSGVMARLGLSYEQLKAIKPDIVMVSMSAFGVGGPYDGYAGYGGSIEAISGLQALTAYSEDSPRYRVREVDVLNGFFGLCAALTALVHRQRHGAGQWMELSETETTGWLVGEFFAQASASGKEPAVLGNRHAVHAPQGCYACAGEERYLTICITGDAQWRQFATIVGGDKLADDPRYTTVAARRAAHDELDALIGAWAKTQDAVAAMHVLQSADIAAGLVCNVRDLANDPHLAARDWFLKVGELRLPGLPFHMQRGDGTPRRRGPDLGQDNAQYAERYGALTIDDMLALERLGTAYQ